MNTCECCHLSEVQTTLHPVLIDENMETYLCGMCIRHLRAEVSVEVIDLEK